MSIKSQGGVFGRNPTFNDVTVEGDLSISGTLSVGGETITGLSYQGGWNASTNAPDIAASGPVTGQFWIVSADGSTDVGGITNWTSGDWALYDGSNWQRVEGGNTDLTTGVQGQLAIANGGTGAADASTARTNLGLGSAATTASTDYATAAQGALADSAIQPADLGTAAYTASTDYATSAQGSLADSSIQPADIGTIASQDANNVNIDGGAIDGTPIGANSASTGKFSTLFSNTTAKATSLNSCISGNLDNFLTNGIYAGYSTTNNPTATSAWVFLEVLSNGTDQLKQVCSIANYAGGGVYKRYSANSGSSWSSWVRMAELNSSGNLAFASGSGIDFSATSGTGTSELLDDYEEGTFTVGAGNLTYTGTFSGSGYYTKIGNVVTVNGTLSATTLSGGAGTFFGALPFTPASQATGDLVQTNRGAGCHVLAYTNGYIYVTGFNYPSVQFTITYKV